MGINFGESTPAPAMPTGEVLPSNDGFSLDLSKDSFLDLSKAAPGLQNIRLAAGWDVATAGQSADLDIAAFMLDENGKIYSLEDVIFFKHKSASGITLNGDNLTGAGEGDDETMDIVLNQIPSKYKTIKFCITIYDADAKQQTFGMVNNAYVRVLNKDENDKEICKFRLKEEYSTSTSVIVAELRNNNGNWEFAAIGEGVRADLNGIANMFR